MDPRLPIVRRPACPSRVAPGSDRSIACRLEAVTQTCIDHHQLDRRVEYQALTFEKNKRKSPYSWVGCCAYWKYGGRERSWWTWHQRPARIPLIGNKPDPWLFSWDKQKGSNQYGNSDWQGEQVLGDDWRTHHTDEWKTWIVKKCGVIDSHQDHSPVDQNRTDDGHIVQFGTG